MIALSKLSRVPTNTFYRYKMRSLCHCEKRESWLYAQIDVITTGRQVMLTEYNTVDNPGSGCSPPVRFVAPAPCTIDLSP